VGAEARERDGHVHAVTGRDLHRTYRASGRETAAVRGVDLDVSVGEWVAIMGPSGCGKSTLLHLLGGLDRPDHGTVCVGDDELTAMSETQLAVLRRRRIGYVFQFFNLVSDLSVAENVELPLLLAGASRADARRRREALLDRLGLGDLGGSSPAQLSGGQQQRVAIARALANEPEVLLADEPTGNLDSAAMAEVLDVLRTHHDAGQTIVMVTHDDRVGAAADRIIRMADGLVVG
jgi:putative ABC transport system ATP-binding protein